MKNRNESGRSMVEMLGVLAIIGVLSIGGIAGYTMAMNKYNANEIVNAVVRAAIECRTRNTIPADITADGLGEMTCLSQATGAVQFSVTSTAAIAQWVCRGMRPGTSYDAATGLVSAPQTCAEAATGTTLYYMPTS